VTTSNPRNVDRKLPERLRMQIAESRLDLSLSNREFFQPWERS
jgi:hypothetical protein